MADRKTCRNNKPSPMTGLNRMKENMRTSKAIKATEQQMKCPECGEVSIFTYFYQVPYDAPVVVEDGKVLIDYENADDNGGCENGEGTGTCMCHKCGNEVLLDEIELVDADEEMSEELRREFSRFFVDPQNTVKRKPKTRPRLGQKIAAKLGISDGKEVA